MEKNSCIRQQADIEQINRCKDTVSELNESFDYLANGLSLVGNNVRLKILYLLFQEKRLCVCDLSDILGMNISAISQHLRKMKDRNLLQTERDAQTIFYSLTAEYEKMLNPFFEILDKNKMSVNSIFLMIDNKPLLKYDDFIYRENIKENSDDISESNSDWNIIFLSGYIEKGCHEITIIGLSNETLVKLEQKIELCRI